MQDNTYIASCLTLTVESWLEVHNQLGGSLRRLRAALDSPSGVGVGGKAMRAMLIAALVWLGLLITATAVLAAAYVFDFAAHAFRQGLAGWRLVAHSSTYRARLALAKMRRATKT